MKRTLSLILILAVALSLMGQAPSNGSSTVFSLREDYARNFPQKL